MNQKRQPRQTKSMKRVGFLFDFRIGFDRNLYKATVNYQRSSPPFQIVSIMKPVRDYAELFQGKTIYGLIDAMVGRFIDRPVLDALLEAGCPLISWFPDAAMTQIPMVASDDVAVGEMVARHYLQKGHQDFAFVGQNSAWSHQRFQGFRQALEAAGKSCTHFLLECDSPDDKYRSASLARLKKLIQQLLSGTAVMTANDSLGSIFISHAGQLGIEVPADLSVIGVDDDEMTCEFVSPVPLSSAIQDYDQIIRKTGDLMQRLLQGQPLEAEKVLVPPLRIHQRLSSEFTSLGDPHLNKAMTFILKHAHEDIGIDDIARAAGISKQALRRKFKDRLHLAPHMVVTRQRVTMAQNQLAEGVRDIEQIVESCGFGSTQRFYINFRQITGMSPREYKKKHRQPPPKD